MIELLKSEIIRRLFVESSVRIENCLNRLTHEQIWSKPNQNTNSIGNLILHLMGNVRQYICSGIDRQKDVRQRHSEFLPGSAYSKDDLLKMMADLRVDVEKVITNLTDEKLTRQYSVQGFEESGMSIIIHVIEHFSYHVGQIAVQTKLIKNEDLGFYAGLDLNAKSS